jgi:Dyp-type peroxidase family
MQTIDNASDDSFRGFDRSELADIQRNTVKALPVDKASYRFIKITNPAGFRAFLAALLKEKAMAGEPTDGEPSPYLAINIGFTSSGLEQLGVSKDIIDSFPQVFRDGMAARAEQLGDIGTAAPQYWDGWLGSVDVHAVLVLSASPAEALQKLEKRLGELVEQPRVDCFELLDSATGEWARADSNAPRREHFGFRDGIGQPLVKVKTKPARNTRMHGAPNVVAAGEFILGYLDEDGSLQNRPCDINLARSGTYMVFRKLAQDVAGFRRFLTKNGRTEQEKDLLAAQMVGRWQDGTPLAVSPTGGIGDATNEFTYEADKDGHKCPFTAHIRRANPRDSKDLDEVSRHRIIRRGIPYGPRYDATKEDGQEDDNERGMLFVCFNSRIDLQFEFLQREWINKGDFFGHASAVKDPLVGNNEERLSDQFILPGEPVPIYDVPRFVMLKGGDYFFLPGINALKLLAEGGFQAEALVQGPAAPAINLAPMPPKRFDPLAMLPALLKTGATQYDAELNTHVVGTHKAVEQILKDGETFPAEIYRRRMSDLIDGPSLIAMGQSPEKDAYATALRQVTRASDIDQIIRPLVRNAARARIEDIGKKNGILDVVVDLARMVPILLADRYFGIRGPTKFSEGFIAARYEQKDISHVRPEWRKEFEEWRGIFEKTHPAGSTGVVMLGYWARNAFRHVFLNPFANREISELAVQSTHEFVRHVREQIDAAKQGETPAETETVLARMLMAQRGNAFWSDDRIRNALLELVVGGIETVSKAVTHVVDVLLQERRRLERAQQAANAGRDDELDAIIAEALRLRPVAEVLFRTVSRDAMIGDNHETIVRNDALICLHMIAAARDGRYFTDIDPSAFAPQRERTENLSFGLDPHQCFAREMAKAEVREIVKRLVTQPNLRRAAGPSGQLKYESEWMPLVDSLVVRFDKE